jgi:demethylmenaquinone methyltransferase/2-methoxy-6-polyprenyl-1,4-benzoquinol methylase
VRNTNRDIYRPEFVRGLFDEMSRTYGVVNYISSFGFCKRWRRQCVEAAPLIGGSHVHDYMSGMGELWPDIARRIGEGGSILAVDFSAEMCRRARENSGRIAVHGIQVVEADILDNPLPEASADAVLSSFGLKTFSPEQRKALAGEVARVLKPGGVFSFVEISVPPNPLLRALFLFYLKRVIPLIGRLFLGNPDNYRMLGVYTEAFGSCAGSVEQFRAAGLDARVRHYFFGCATGVAGSRPAT